METILASSKSFLEPNKFSGSVNGDGKQIATLVVSSTLTTVDSTYTCKVRSSAFDQSAEAIVTASLNVFGELRSNYPLIVKPTSSVKS